MSILATTKKKKTKVANFTLLVHTIRKSKPNPDSKFCLAMISYISTSQTQLKKKYPLESRKAKHT